jgi:hypothetical protein
MGASRVKPKMVFRGAVALTVAATLCLCSALPGTAGAATQLGQVSPANPPVCDAAFGQSTPHNLVQEKAATAPYTVPSPGGVITRWSHRGIFLKLPGLPDTPRAGSGRLQVWDRTPSSGLFVLLGRSELETFTPGVVTTFLTRIPVSAGDVLGLRSERRTGCVHPGLQLFGDGIGYAGGSPDPAPGETGTFAGIDQVLLNVSAVLEPDADADAFGDETQDGCPGQAGPESGCPPGTAPPLGDGPPGGGSPGDGSPSNEFSFGKLKKNKRKGTAKLTVEVPGPGVLALTETEKVKGTDEQADAEGGEKVAIKPKGKAKKKLNKKGRAKVKAEVTYSPEGGASNTDSKKVGLKKR